MTLYTIGHSTRTLQQFLDLLCQNEMEVLADVRSFPGSRRFPHFNAEALQQSVEAAGMQYLPFKDLGGRRKVKPESHNTAWQHPAFRGYADYMETPEFAAGAQRLLQLLAEKRTAIMCAEAVWWRCHRGLISDWMKLHGVQVLHILSRTKLEEHPYTRAARIVDGRLNYEAEAEQPELELD